MKSIKFVVNEKNEKTAIKIDLKSIEKLQVAIEELLDGIIAESRKNYSSGGSWTRYKIVIY